MSIDEILENNNKKNNINPNRERLQEQNNLKLVALLLFKWVDKLGSIL